MELKVPTRRFGRTNLEMPVLTCGGMRYQQAWEDLKPETVQKSVQENLEATIHHALAHGINHIETARGYGSSEMQLGRSATFGVAGGLEPPGRVPRVEYLELQLDERPHQSEA